jgi:geranyl-CoA carboxylase beta subunit
MAVIESRIDPSNEAFKANRAAMLQLIDEFRALEGRVRETSNSKKDLFEKRGQLLPRERIALLLDKGAPWLELSPLAGLGMHDDDGKRDVLGGGLITGIGYVSGVRCLIKASDSAIKGGTIAPMGLKKNLRAQEIAMINKLPLVDLVESGGANLRYQAEIFVEGGQGFRNQARLSAAGIPQVTVVHGSSTAGGAYQPGLSDYVVMVRGKAKVFLAGPPLLRAATGEIATDEALGGAEMHATVAGTAEYLAENDADGIRLAREIVAKLNWNERLPPSAPRNYDEPRYSIDELAGVAPIDYRNPTTCAKSSRASSTARTFSISNRSTAPPPCAAKRRFSACPAPSSATTARSTRRARPRRRSSSSLCARPARRSCICKTPPAISSAPKPNKAASSNTARR